MRSPDTKRSISDMSWSWLGLEIGVLGANVAAFGGIARLFTSFEPMATILVAVLLTHGVCISCRWARVPMPFAALISALAVGLSTLSATFPQTIHHVVIPTRLTLTEIERVGYEAWNQFITVRAPTEPAIGFTLAAVAGAWLVAVVSDTIAFRLGFLIEAIVPPGVVMVLVAALAPPQYRLEAVLAFGAAVALVVTSARVRELSREAWLGRRPKRAGAFAAVVFIVSALAVTGYVATHPPAWATDGVIDLQGGTKERGVQDRSPGDPLVSTRARLVEQSDVTMFKIRWKASPAYWRQNTLDVYQDENWTASPAEIGAQNPMLPITAAQTATITVEALRSRWMPVPDGARVVGVNEGGILKTAPNVQFDTARNGFVVKSMRKSAQYVVQVNPEIAPAEVVFDTQRQTAGIPPEVVELAKAVTDGATDDVARAKLLEAFFLKNFTYDLAIARTNDLGLNEFLFSVRRGYCEQFASSFAVMARAVGIPSRVATGFVRGAFSAGDQTYEVKGKDAHAWPEVFVAGAWTRFEPTPGRLDDQPLSPTTTPPPTTSAPVTTRAPTATTVPLGGQQNQQTSEPIDLPLRPFIGLLTAVFVLGIPSMVRRVRFGRGIAPDADDIPVGLNRSVVGLEDDLAWIGCPRPSGQPITAFVESIDLSHTGTDPLVWLPATSEALSQVESMRYQGLNGDSVAAASSAITEARRQVRASIPLSWKMRRLMSFSPRPKPKAEAAD